MLKIKWLILGAGPAGLTVANKLKEVGEKNFLVLEKEAEAGGLCRSIEVDKSPLDIGGGHFLDVKRQDVNDFLFSFMPKGEWNLFNRDSRIAIHNVLINHPIEANIWQLDLNEQVEYLKSIATAGCNIGLEKPNKFLDWIFWKLGKKIAENYMIPYNQKMFGQNLNQLGTYWLEKLPNVSFEETLLSCLKKMPYGEQPGHAQFYYPKEYGYGELWLRMANAIVDNIEYNKNIYYIDFNSRTIMTTDGQEYQADNIITTIPWMAFEEIKGMPESIAGDIGKLKYSSIQVQYVPERLDTSAHWIYYPEQKLPYHRILVRHNFCQNSVGYWTETNSERLNTEIAGTSFTYNNQYAYPMNTVDKPEIMKRLLSWSKQHGVIGLGRWGEHQHYNSDVTVDLAMKLVDRLLSEVPDYK